MNQPHCLLHVIESYACGMEIFQSNTGRQDINTPFHLFRLFFSFLVAHLLSQHSVKMKWLARLLPFVDPVSLRV